MATTVSSTNPNDTSGRASGSYTTLTYPLSESLEKGTILRFIQYERAIPSSNAENKITSIINLPVPMNIPDNTAINIKDFSGAAMWANAAEAVKFLGGDNVVDKVKQQFEGFDAKKLPKDAARIAALSGLALNDDRANIASIVGGVIRNPHTTMYFDGMVVKAYNLSWRLSARSKAESDAINNIINTVKMRISPEEAYSGIGLDYPDLVFVEFKGDIKNYLPKYQKSFVTNFTVAVEGGGGLVFYKGGAPVDVEIQMSFQELNIQTRNILRGEAL
jgi:hypothetical protein